MSIVRGICCHLTYGEVSLSLIHIGNLTNHQPQVLVSQRLLVVSGGGKVMVNRRMVLSVFFSICMRLHELPSEFVG